MAWRPAPTVRNPLLALRRVVEAPEPDGLEYVEVLGAAVAVAEWAPRGRVEHEHVELHSRSEDIELRARQVPPEVRASTKRRRSRGRQERSQPIPDRPVRALITSTPVPPRPPDDASVAPGPEPTGPDSTGRPGVADPAPDEPSSPGWPSPDRPSTDSPSGPDRPSPSRPSPSRPSPDRPSSDWTSADQPAADCPSPDRSSHNRSPHDPPSPAHAAAGPWSTLPDAPPSTPTLLRLGARSPAGGATATATGRSATVVHGLPVVTARGAPAGDGPVAPARTPPRRDPTPELPSARPTAPTLAPELPSTRSLAPDDAPPSAFLPRILAPPPPTERAGRRPMTVVEVALTMIVALTLWALVDAPNLLHGAETAPRGARRDAALDVLRPLDRVSAALGLDRITHLTDDLLGRHPAAPPAVTPRLPRASGRRSGPFAGPPAAPPTFTPTTAPRLAPLRVGTTTNPVRVLAVGDSLGLDFGRSVESKLDAGGIVHTTVDGRVATGLTRPDSFDWGTELRSDLAQFRPEVVIAMFGGNDDQDAIVGGRFIPFGTQAWGEIYGARVASFAAAVHASGARLLWAGLPVMRSADKTQRTQTVMAVTRDVLAGRDGAMFVDDSATLADGSGHYAFALPDASGQLVIVREPDGVHFSPSGGDRLADRAIASMQGSWHLVLHAAQPPHRGQA